MIKVDYISDWAARLRSRLYTQFRNKVTWEGWIQLLAKQAQDMEDAVQTVFSITSIDDSVGIQLDVIGLLIGQPRLGVNDALYRIYLKARILANRSTGTASDIYAVFHALYGSWISMKITTSPIRSFALLIRDKITAAQAAIGVNFLTDSKEAGARAILQWDENGAGAFRFDAGPGFDVGHWGGAKQA